MKKPIDPVCSGTTLWFAASHTNPHHPLTTKERHCVQTDNLRPLGLPVFRAFDWINCFILLCMPPALDSLQLCSGLWDAQWKLSMKNFQSVQMRKLINWCAILLLAWCLLHSSSNCTCAACQYREQCGCVVCSLYSALLIQPRVSRLECQIVHQNRSCATLSRFPLAWCLLRCCSKRAYMLRQDCERCGQLRSVNNAFAALDAASRLSRMLCLMKSQLVYFSTQSSLLPFSALFLQFCLVVRQDCWKFDVLSLLLQSPRLSSLFFWHEKSTFNWLYVLPQAASSSRLLCSSSNRAYIMRKDSDNVDVLSLLLQSPRLSSLFFGMKSQHSTDSMFYSKQPLPRVFCALPPIVPTSCVKTLAMWMYCLYCFNHLDSLRCYLAWKVNIQLTLCFTPSSLFLASSVLFLQSCLHHASRLWQCGCIVFIASIT